LIHLSSLSIGCVPLYRFLDTNNANAYQIRTFVLIFLPIQNGNRGVIFLPVEQHCRDGLIIKYITAGHKKQLITFLFCK